MAETYRRKPPVYKAVQVTNDTLEEIVELIREFGYGRASEYYWRHGYAGVEITGEKMERKLYKDFRYAPIISKPEFPLLLGLGTWIVTSRDGVEIHSDASLAAYFDKD